MLLNLTTDQRDYLQQMRALSSDEAGREIFVGLSRWESEEFLGLLFSASRSADETDRELELAERHESIRSQIVGAEAEAKRADTKH